MSAQQKYKSSFGFIDLLFNLLVGFTFMFILAFMLINPIAKKHDFDPKAEYMVVMTWDPKSPTDIDMWVQDDLNNVVSFRDTNKGLMHLDRDDLGYRNDIIFNKTTGEKVKFETNREVLTIRSRVPRSVTVTGHWFSKRVDQTTNPETVTFELIQLNPYKEIIIKSLVLNGPGDEKHALGFTITDDGEVELDLDNTDLIVNKASNMSQYKDPFTPGETE
jgi:hypothetical protein